MATEDCPGFGSATSDVLAAGCWAEHDDGSLIFVEGTENGNVVYSIFDMGQEPIIEYRDIMVEARFKREFSWSARTGGRATPREKWTWHDKTPFPWNRVIQKGAADGPRYPSADHILSAAERVAQSLRLRGHRIAQDMNHRTEQVVQRSATIWDKVRRAVNELRK